MHYRDEKLDSGCLHLCKKFSDRINKDGCSVTLNPEREMTNNFLNDLLVNSEYLP